MWLLDIWAEGDTVTKLRLHAQDNISRSITDLRIVDPAEILSSGELALPRCPASETIDLTWEPELTTPLDITLDPNGRPYEVSYFEPPPQPTRETIGSLTSPDGELLVMDGNAVQVNPALSADESVSVSVASSKTGGPGPKATNVDVIWDSPNVDKRSPVGVWLGPPGATVERWDDFEFAYGTGGGIGGIVSSSAIAKAAELGREETWVKDPDFVADYKFYDLDGIPGDDTFIFSNGWGDGAFPMARGRGSNGEIVAIVIWSTAFPWRLAVPEGEPPAWVTGREENLLECIDGTRPVDASGECEFDEQYQ